MTLSPWIIYLWGISDDVKAALGIAAAIFLIITFAFALIAFIEEIDGAVKAAVVTGVTAFLFGYFSALIPSSKTIAVMIVAPAIINSDPIQKDLPELYKAAKDALMSTLTKQP